MIRKSKNNEDKPDFKEMWSEVNKNIQEQDAEQDIISRVPELKELSGNIDKATNNCVNATLQCESVIRQYQRAEEKLDNAVDTITTENVAHVAMLLFAGYIDAAASLSESCGGGGGSSPESGWGKKDDEDERTYARRCLQIAHSMCKPKSIKRGYHR